MTWDMRFQTELLRRLRRHMAALGYHQGGVFFQRIREEIERIVAEHAFMVIDEKTRPHLRLTSSVLACYRAVASGPLKKDQAFEVVEESFVSIGRMTLNLYTRWILLFSKDPFKAITTAGRKALDRYGAAWDFSFEETPTLVTMTCTKCFYSDFFKVVGVQPLTRIFCSWDQNWMRPIDLMQHGVRFERPTTMGYGGELCSFIFERVESSAG